MIRSIAYEIFDRLTTDPEALRFTINIEREHHNEIRDRLTEDCFALQRELAAVRLQLESSPSTVEHTVQAAALADARLAVVVHEANSRRLQERLAEAQQQLGNQLHLNDRLKSEQAEELAQLRSEISTAHLEIARLQKAYANFSGTELTIEPTWVLALWSQMAEIWTEQERGSYDAMMLKMRERATPWNLFPRSAWDALVKNGRAR